jgi:hypothetical protein
LTEIAACRIDFAGWLEMKMLPKESWKITLMLASSEMANEAAKNFGVTAARISKLTLWLKQSWHGFQSKQLAAA